MNKIVYIIIGTILLTSCLQKETTINEISDMVKMEYSEHKSMSYDITYKIKYFSSDDTIEVSAKCILISEKQDSLFGGQVWFNTTDSIEKFYDLENIYSVDDKSKTITEYRPHEGQTWAITGNSSGDLYKVYFFNNEKFIKTIQDSTNYISISDTAKNQVKYWLVDIRYQDSPPFTNLSRQVWISKKTRIIDKISYSAKFQNNFQYNEWSLSNIYFDKYDNNHLFELLRSKLDSYEVSQYIEKEKEEIEPLEIGFRAPSFEGITYPGKSTFNISDFSGKVIVLDFWYMSCFPCVQAIPHLSELYEKYNKNGLEVFGLNPTDNDEAGLNRLPDFIDYNHLIYPIVFVEREIPELYKVIGYPTFYIINKKGEIVYSQIGFGEQIMPKIDSIIQAELK